jgi:hypothetical protein
MVLFNQKRTRRMKDSIKKWWNRKWDNWEHIQDLTYSTGELSGIILKRRSNDGLVQFKKIR